MATPPPVTDAIARFVTETEFSTLTTKTRANAKLHILDVLGVALAGVSTQPAVIARDYCKSLGVSAEASVWGTDAKASVSTAAFANGLFAHALDFDDWDAFIHVGHPTSMLIGAALPAWNGFTIEPCWRWIPPAAEAAMPRAAFTLAASNFNKLAQATVAPRLPQTGVL